MRRAVLVLLILASCSSPGSIANQNACVAADSFSQLSGSALANEGVFTPTADALVKTMVLLQDRVKSGELSAALFSVNRLYEQSAHPDQVVAAFQQVRQACSKISGS